jgi:hypothetical protein
MLDSETVIRSPHDATVTPPQRGHDPRTSVTITDQGCDLVLFFDDLSGEGPLLELRILPASGAPFAPWLFMPRLPRYLDYARAAIAFNHRDATKALQALRAAGNTRRGLSTDFYRLIARDYQTLVEEGEKYPVKALAIMRSVVISTASRWVTEAKRRGLITAD